MRPLPRLSTLLALAWLAGCGGPATPDRWLGEITPVPSAAGPGSRYAHLGSGAGQVVLSWLQPLPDGRFALQHARWTNGAWSPAGTVANGADWFVNWADFPSVVPVDERTWAAHWLQQQPGNVYSYDVRIVVSSDAGSTWSAPMSPHDDGTLTEHGFVTLLADGGDARAVWLDGRHTGGEHDHAGDAGAMTLRSAIVGADGRRLGSDEEVDARVCDCCQTDAALTSEGTVVVYRDRSPDEVRDIAIVRHAAGHWSEPVHVHADGWKIDACPVNGPAIDARDESVVVAWFTAPDVPRVRLAFSQDGGRSFARAVEVATGAHAVGRVDVVLLEDGRAVASWLQQSGAGAEIRAQPFDRDGPAGAPVVIASSSVQRSSGFPQMVRAGDGLLFAWTESGEAPQVRTAFARLR